MTCVYGYSDGYTSTQDLIVTGQGDDSVSFVLRAPSGGATLSDFYSFCPGFTVGADDRIDIYRVADLTPVTTETLTLPVSTTATSATNRRAGGALHPSGATVAISDSFMTAASKTYASLISASPLVPNEYRGDYVSSWGASPAVPPTWSFVDTSATLAHREFFGLPSVPASVFAAGVDRATPFTSASFHIGDNTTNLGTPIVSGRRVTGLTATAFAHRLVNPVRRSSEFDAPYRLRLGLVIGSKTYLGPSVLMPSEPEDVSYTWRLNPATGREWTQSQLAAFRSAQTSAVVLWMTRPNDPDVIRSTAGAVYRLTATVSHVAETRVGRAFRQSTTQTLGWNRWNALNLAGSSLSLASDTEYLLNWSRLSQEESDRRSGLRPRDLGVRAVGDSVGTVRTYPQVVRPAFIDGVPRNVGERTGLVPAVGSSVFVATAINSGVSTVVGQRARGVASLDPGFPETVSSSFWIDPTTGDPDPDRVVFTVRSQFDGLPSGPLTVRVEQAPAGPPGATIATAADVLPEDLAAPQQWLTVERELTATAGGWTVIPALVPLAVTGAAATEGPAGAVTPQALVTVQSPAKVITFDTFVTGDRVDTLTLNAGENDGKAAWQIIDDVYVGTDTVPARVVKVGLSSLLVPSRTGAITLSTNEDRARAFTDDGTNLYVVTGDTGVQPRLVKINLGTFTRTSSVTVGSSGEIPTSVLLDNSGGYVWVGLATAPGKVVLVDTSTMTVDSTITLPSGANDVRCLAGDATHIYALTDTGPIQVYKIDRVGGTVVDSLTLPSGSAAPLAACLRDDGLYIVESGPPGRVSVVDTVRMSFAGVTVDYDTVGIPEDSASAAYADGFYVTWGTSDTPSEFTALSIGSPTVVDPSGAYYVTFEANAADTGWQVLTQRTGEDDPGVTKSPQAPAPFQQFTYADFWSGPVFYYEESTEVVGTALSASVAVAPSVPSGLDVEVVDPDDGSPCRPLVRVEWNAHVPDTCDVVTEWEVQRRDDRTDWQTIMVVDVDVTEVWDVEAARNMTSEYRVRSVFRDDAYRVTSGWCDPEEVTTSDDCCGYVIASNHLGAGDYLSTYPSPEDRTLWYDDVAARSYSLLEDVTFVEFESGDGAEIVRPLVDRLDEFETRLLVAGRGTTDPSLRLGSEVGRRLFDPLAEFSGNKRNAAGRLVRVPYVAVLDSDGNRWLAQVETPTGVRAEPAGSYTLVARVREVTRTVVPVTVTEPMTQSGS